MFRSCISCLPLASLLICSRNRPQLLHDTIDSVLEGNVVPTELIIVDQSDRADPDLETFQTERPCVVRYIWTASRGLSNGRNIGISAAQYDIIVIIDDDMFVASDWFAIFITALVSAGERAVVTGRVLRAEAERLGGFVPALVSADAPAVYQGRIGTDVLAGGHMIAYRSTFTEVGGFDGRLGAGGLFPAADDNDLGFRLLEAGYRIVYEPEAIIYHRAWRSMRDYLPMRWSYGRGKGGYYAKYLSLRDPYMLRRLAWDIGHRIWAFPRRLWYERHRAAGDIVYIFGIILGSLKWLLTQRKPH